MYEGYFGAALATKGIERRIPTIAALVAAVGFDLFPPAHWLAVAPLAAFAVYAMARRRWHDRRMAVTMCALALSHLVFDFVTGVQLWPGATFVGLFDRVPHFRLVDLAIEGALVVVGWALYRRVLSPPARQRWETKAMLAFMLATQLLFDRFRVRTTSQAPGAGSHAALGLLGALVGLIVTIAVIVALDRRAERPRPPALSLAD
jgi:hypothetical protein